MKTPPRFSILLAAMLIHAATAQAQIMVTTLTDENDTPAGAQISLREALRDSATGGQITFDPELAGKVIVLTGGEIVVAGKTVSVNASGGLVIEARGLSRIFRVETGTGLNLTGLTLQGGRAPADGGAILNAGTLNLTDCILRDNRAAGGTDGVEGTKGTPPSYPGAADGVIPGGGGWGTNGANGGAVSSTGSLMALRCRFTGNAAGNGGHGGTGGSGGPNWQGNSGGPGGQGGTGGAIHSSGDLTLTGCIFESNTSGAGGNGGDTGQPWGFGGIYGPGGTSGNGGAVFQSGSMTVESSSLTGNSCSPGGIGGHGGSSGASDTGGYSGSGSALFWSNGTATLTNCTLTGNGTAESYVSAGSTQEHGGAVGSTGGTLLHLVHCTVAQNTSSRTRAGSAPAAWVTATAAGIVSKAPVQCENCILSGNAVDRAAAGSPPDWQEVNFSPDTQRTVIPAAPLGGAPGENAQLGSLVLSGGPLPVLVPGAASPALNAGVVLNSPPATDQRGLPRAADAPDLGAVEIQVTEPAGPGAQAITFAPPAQVELTSVPLVVPLSATASSGLPVSFEVVTGTATVNGSTLTLTATGTVAIRALQAGDAVTAPAVPVLRVIEVTGVQQTIPFESGTYAFYPGSPRTVTLPEFTSAGQTITWSVAGAAPAGITLSGRVVTAGSSGTLQIKGEHPGAGPYAAISRSWTLTFSPGNVWWETPPYFGGPPIFFSLAEGSPWGLTMAASIASPHTGPVSVPALPGGLIATPSVIPAGGTSVSCEVTLPANPQFVNERVEIRTNPTGGIGLTLCLANRTSVPLQISGPARVVAGTSVTVTATCPSVFTPGLAGPPIWSFGSRTVTVSAVDFDNPAVAIPVTLTSQTFPGQFQWFTPKSLQVTFQQTNRRAKLTVTTNDGLTGSSGPIELVDDANADGDGVNDIVEAALQRPAAQRDAPPLTIERDAAGLHAVLGNRPVDLQGWTITVEMSADLTTWSPAPADSTTVTSNPDGTTDRVSVLLPAGTVQFVRLRVTKP